jgi:hypothetical protein
MTFLLSLISFISIYIIIGFALAILGSHINKSFRNCVEQGVLLAITAWPLLLIHSFFCIFLPSLNDIVTNIYNFFMSK